MMEAVGNLFTSTHNCADASLDVSSDETSKSLGDAVLWPIVAHATEEGGNLVVFVIFPFDRESDGDDGQHCENGESEES